MNYLRSVALLALLVLAGCSATVVETPFEETARPASPVSDAQVAAGADRFPIAVDGRWGYIDGSGTVVIEPQFEEAHAFAEGLARVAVAGRYGYIDPTGVLAVDPRFLRAFDFSLGRARVVLPAAEVDARSRDALPEARRLEAFIDTGGTVVVPAVLAEARNFGGEQGAARAPVVRTQIRNYVPLGLDLLSFLSLRLQDEGAWEIIGPDGRAAARLENANVVLGLSEGRLPFATDVGGWPFGGERWGYLGADGSVRIEPQFLAAFGFSEGRAAVVVDDRFGYIAPDGAEAISLQFDYARTFRNGLAYVRAASQEGYIDASGTFVWTQPASS